MTETTTTWTLLEPPNAGDLLLLAVGDSETPGGWTRGDGDWAYKFAMPEDTTRLEYPFPVAIVKGCVALDKEEVTSE